MKLYATTTSERASKGQGGNKQLKVEILVETEKGREVAGIVEMRVEGETIHLISSVPQYKVYIKGNKQKGEVCEYCGTKEGSKKHCDPNNPKLLHSWETGHN